MNPSVSRRVVHPLLFGLRKEPVYRHLADLEKEQFLAPGIVQTRQLELLAQQVALATKTSSVYRDLLEEKGSVPGSFDDLSDLARLPILEKIHLSDIHRDLLAGSTSLAAHTVRKTGGSTGEPCVVLADRESTSRCLAARALCQGWYGLEVGDRQIRLWGHPLKTGLWQSRAKDLLLNRIRVDSLFLAPDRIESLLKRIRRFGVEYIYGYASLIRLFAENMPGSELPEVFDGLKAVISTSETLLPEQKANLADFFRCPVVNEYGCSEVDIISFTCPEGGQHVVASNLIVEVVPFDTDPEGYGQVVVTDLHNTMMPVIRYRVGDLAPLGMTSCRCGRGWPCMGPILGRAQGQYIVLSDGRKVHSQFVVYMLEDLLEEGLPISQFKIFQVENDRLLVQVSGPDLGNMDIDRVLDYCRDQGEPVLGCQMTWRVDKVEQEELERGRVNKYQHFESLLDSP